MWGLFNNYTFLLFWSSNLLAAGVPYSGSRCYTSFRIRVIGVKVQNKSRLLLISLPRGVFAEFMSDLKFRYHHNLPSMLMTQLFLSDHRISRTGPEISRRQIYGSEAKRVYNSNEVLLFKKSVIVNE